MNYTKAVAFAAFTLSIAVPVAAAPSNALLIVPGQRIGHTLLGHDGAFTLAHLPKPTRSDAGMSQQYFVWVSPAPHGTQNTLFVHATDNGALNVKPLSGLTFDTVRVTSPSFATQTGLHVGSTLAQVRRQFPHLQSANADQTLFDDKSSGIAFEFASHPDSNARAISVSVHTPGQPATATKKQVSELLKTP